MLTLSRSILICILISQFILLCLCGYKVLIKKILIIITGGILVVTICSIAFPEIINTLRNIMYMLLAVFNDNYAAMLGNARENDYRVCLQLKKKYGDRIEIAPPFNTPIEAKSYIANMNIFIEI